ncbi:MAG: ABC transporter permease [Hymenobacteraceae bacterium]|nr:ABC transporter permease [Hymenobacteraceae bacterium]
MNFLENIRESLQAIRVNLLRTVLTALIVAIGILALVGILTAIDALQASLTSTFSSMGAGAFDIRAKGYGNRRFGGKVARVYPPTSWVQARTFQDQMTRQGLKVSLSTRVAGALRVAANGLKTNPNMRVVGVDENYLAAQNLDLGAGRGFSARELAGGANVCVVGAEISTSLFKGRPPIGDYINVLGQRFQVVGMLARTGSSMKGTGGDRQILVPILCGNRLPRQQALTYDLKTLVPDPTRLDYTVQQATGTMRAVRQDRPGQEDSFDIERSDSLLSDLNELTGSARAAGFVVGFITLLGAAIALMNIMLVSVTERTREIGIRKALGATSLQIRQQFLIEAIVICLLGGILGVVLGVAAGNLVTVIAGAGVFIVPWLWMGLGLGICVTVGLISGYYPAAKASRLDPIESLRYE